MSAGAFGLPVDVADQLLTALATITNLADEMAVTPSEEAAGLAAYCMVTFKRTAARALLALEQAEVPLPLGPVASPEVSAGVVAALLADVAWCADRVLYNLGGDGSVTDGSAVRWPSLRLGHVISELRRVRQDVRPLGDPAAAH